MGRRLYWIGYTALACAVAAASWSEAHATYRSGTCPFGGTEILEVVPNGTFETCVERDSAAPFNACEYDVAIPYDDEKIFPIDVERNQGFNFGPGTSGLWGVVNSELIVAIFDLNPNDPDTALEDPLIWPGTNPQIKITWQATPTFGYTGQGARVPKIGTTGLGQDYTYDPTCTEGSVELMQGQVIVVPEAGTYAGMAAGLLLLGWLGRRRDG